MFTILDQRKKIVKIYSRGKNLCFSRAILKGSEETSFSFRPIQVKSKLTDDGNYCFFIHFLCSVFALSFGYFCCLLFSYFSFRSL